MTMRHYSSYWSGDGNLTAPIEVRYLPSGTPVGTTRIAIREVWDDPKKGRQTHTSFLNLVFWGEGFVEEAKHFQKGQNIHAEGALKSRAFESGGYKRTVTEITVARAFGIAPSDTDDHNELPEDEGINGSNDANSNDDAGWPQIV
jgi:single stranded DNA-binding protein